MYFIFYSLSLYLSFSRTMQDYGTLLCWGRNEIGAQTEPCIYHINPAGNYPIAQ